MGILDTLGLVMTLVFALPVALLGIDLVVSGRTVAGVALLVVAVLMVVIKRYIATPDDVPTAAAEKAASAVVKEEGERD